ncbi:MAG: hypothetical protein HY908_29105 [Myxococcales bacterium]|nr:hypothetical protein [Myxococcales bacterium]
MSADAAGELAARLADNEREQGELRAELARASDAATLAALREKLRQKIAVGEVLKRAAGAPVPSPASAPPKRGCPKSNPLCGDI